MSFVLDGRVKEGGVMTTLFFTLIQHTTPPSTQHPLSPFYICWKFMRMNFFTLIQHTTPPFYFCWKFMGMNFFTFEFQLLKPFIHACKFYAVRWLGTRGYRPFLRPTRVIRITNFSPGSMKCCSGSRIKKELETLDHFLI